MLVIEEIHIIHIPIKIQNNIIFVHCIIPFQCAYQWKEEYILKTKEKKGQ